MQFLLAFDDLGLQPCREALLYHELVVQALNGAPEGGLENDVLVPVRTEVRTRHGIRGIRLQSLQHRVMNSGSCVVTLINKHLIESIFLQGLDSGVS